jgi:hypothetical protein
MSNYNHSHEQNCIICDAIKIAEKKGDQETENYKIQLHECSMIHVSVNILDKKTLKILNVREYQSGRYSNDAWIYFDLDKLSEELKNKRKELKC